MNQYINQYWPCTKVSNSVTICLEHVSKLLAIVAKNNQSLSFSVLLLGFYQSVIYKIKGSKSDWLRRMFWTNFLFSFYIHLSFPSNLASFCIFFSGLSTRLAVSDPSIITPHVLPTQETPIHGVDTSFFTGLVPRDVCGGSKKPIVPVTHWAEG